MKIWEQVIARMRKLAAEVDTEKTFDGALSMTQTSVEVWGWLIHSYHLNCSKICWVSCFIQHSCHRCSFERVVPGCLIYIHKIMVFGSLESSSLRSKELKSIFDSLVFGMS